MKRVFITMSIATLLLMTGCLCDGDQTCIQIGAEAPQINVACEKCFESDADYSAWFDKCWTYALLTTVPGNDTLQIQAAADSLCACEL